VRGKPHARKVAGPGAADNWDQRLGFLMHDVSRLRRTVFDDWMRPLGLTRSQWWVLAYLSRHDGMNQSDLADVLEVGKAALGGLIDRLEAAKLVRRASDGHDRRIKRVFLEPQGEQLVAKMVVRNHEMSERILAGLDRQSRVLLADLLTRVKRNLQELKQAQDKAEQGHDNERKSLAN
jgi:DNA-binding MarR family transcriptional regulator